ncbi:MAG TPA: RNA methyltransferase [Bacteriovoracaceae bacterium]|nr:RNA methyltransferase [Bacteriovoracaceae bacterium]
MGIEQTFDIIFGLHSIAAALKNPLRQHEKLVATDEGLIELQKKHNIQAKKIEIRLEIVSSHQLQELGKRYCAELDVEFHRVPSGMFLKTSPLETYDLQSIIKKPEVKLLALDQITDVHNGAAILRTASFYGIDAVLIPSSKSFGLTPSFYRIASGATEFIQLIRVNSLSRAVSQLNDAGIETIGLSEHSESSLAQEELRSKKRICLLLGAEETGLSHAVSRLVQKNMSLTSQGGIKSLNVSAASAIAMEKCFGVS